MPDTNFSTPEIIYNVTIKVERSIAEAWLHWMLQEHIPGVLKTGCFYNHKVVRLLEVDDSEGPTYAVQYFANSLSDYQRYMANYATALRQESMDRWGAGFIAFRSVMEVVR